MSFLDVIVISVPLSKVICKKFSPPRLWSQQEADRDMVGAYPSILY
jgi:hypothetical protein